MTNKSAVIRVRRLKQRPLGYREFQELKDQTEKALLLRYYDWLLWIPKSAAVLIEGKIYCAPLWAIESAKEHPSAKYTNEN